MRPLSPSYRAIAPARIGLGQFAPFINPFEVTGDPTPTTSGVPAPNASGATSKPVAVLTGLMLTGLSAATAYIGISYGQEKNRKNIQRAIGWTVGVVSVFVGIGRLGSTMTKLFGKETG